MNTSLKTTLALAAGLLAQAASAQITFYEHDDFRGRVFMTSRPVSDFRVSGFNDRASSVMVQGGSWEVCEDVDYGGRCVVLRAGSYNSLRDMGFNDRFSSTRRANDSNPADAPRPMATAPYEYRRRPNERVFQAPVTSVRAVVGAATERCWVERQEATQRSEPSAGRGLLGAVIGGVIGHQIGGGTGRDLATVGGAVAGAAIGANTGRTDGEPARDVRRCTTAASTTPEYWDVGYRFRGVQHQVQMSTEPGATVSVNNAGLPRQ